MDQQLAGVGDPHLADAARVLAAVALVSVLSQVGLAEEPTHLANVHSVAVTDIKEPLFEEASGTVGDHAVALHLTKTKAAVARPTLSGLTSKDLGRATATRMHLVAHHMLQTLVISGAQEDLDVESLASPSIVHCFISALLVAQTVELGLVLVHILVVEGSSIALFSDDRGDLAQQALDHMSDGHARRNSVGVHNHIWVLTIPGEGQVFLLVDHTAGSLLSVPGSELVADLGSSDGSHFDFGKPVSFASSCENHLVNDS